MSERTLAPFGQAVLAIRWVTTAISVALASADLRFGAGRVIAATGVLLVHALYRTARPLPDLDGAAGALRIAVETAITFGPVAATGWWDSPLVFSMLTPGAVAGFARGFRFGVGLAVLAATAVSVPWMLDDDDTSGDGRSVAEWTSEVVLVAVVAGYARRISGEADERREAAMDRLGRLSDANVLLFQLHQVTQTLPASLDLTEVLDVTMAQLRELFDAESAAILLHEEADDAWHTARQHGGAGMRSFARADLPPPLLRALALHTPDRELDLRSTGGPGLHESAGSGLYAVLMARGATIGLVALEHPIAQHFTERDLELLSGFIDPAAVAIDNARWFGRLRTIGADEERTRIARDLHDRTGQSLAYLAFELDRIAKQAANGNDVREPIDALRGDVRKVVAELRDTLYDLRTDVTERDGLASTLAAFLERVRERSGLEARLHADEGARLPLLRERELWRIAREAITNVERHAQAPARDVRWTCYGSAALLEISDDGVGLASTGVGSQGSRGLTAMRERAASIGATLAGDADPGKGTRVRCTLAVRS